MPIHVPLKQLPHGADLSLPAYQTAGAAGLDLRATCALDLAPGARALVPTGLAVAIPAGFEGQIRPRSGLAARHGITVLNAPGTIDSDYRGEIKVLLINLGDARVQLDRGERIAQIVFTPVATIQWDITTALPPTSRAGGGFGSTGT